MNRKNIIGSIVFICMFAAALFLSASFPDTVDTYPRIICMVGIVLSGILLGKSVCQQKQSGEEAATNSLRLSQIITILVTLGGTLLYVLLIPVVGYLATTFVFLLLMTYYLDPTSPKIAYLLVGVGFIVLLYLAFGVFLKIPLPRGILI